MGYDEFEQKLREVKDDFRACHGRDPETVRELEDYLRARKTRQPGKWMGRPTLRSLKGLSF